MSYVPAPALEKGKGKEVSSRSDLLKSIEEGKRLRKTVTNDRSAPLISSDSRKKNLSYGDVNKRLPGIRGLFADGNEKTGLEESSSPSRKVIPLNKYTKLYSNNNQNFLKDERKQLISKKSEAPPPPPIGYKPPFPNRTRSFNTGSYGSNPKLSVGSRDDMLISKLSSIPSRRQMKPPNHPPPPPPIPKRVVGTIQNDQIVAETKQHEVTSQDERLIKHERSMESFDLRFASMFKPSSLFPPPEPFTCIQKTYPSKNVQRKFVSRT